MRGVWKVFSGRQTKYEKHQIDRISRINRINCHDISGTAWDFLIAKLLYMKRGWAASVASTNKRTIQL